MRLAHRFACLAVALVLVVGTSAPNAFAKDELALAIPENMPMEDFLALVAKSTDMPLVWNPQDKNIRGKALKGGITLRAPRTEFFSLVRGLLTFYGLVIIPVGPQGYQVQLIADARQSSSILKLKPMSVTLTEENLAKYESSDGLFITTNIKVENMQDLRNARNALTRIVTGQNIGNVTEVPEAKAFVVTDFAPNVVAIYRLLKKMDLPAAKPSTASGTTVAIRLEHARADDLATILTRHYMPKPTGRSSSPRVAPTKSASAPRITADARTNRILVTGNESEVKQVKATIALLDIPVPAPAVSAQLITLSHIGAGRAANTLNSLIGSSRGLWASGGARPSVIAHDERNALLIAASEADLVKIRRLVAEMDTKGE